MSRKSAFSRPRKSPVLGPVTPLEDRTVPATAFALTSANTLLAFDTANPAAASTPVALTGVNPAEALVGIDVRPQNGLLYGLGVNFATDTATVYLISPRTGVATPIGGVGVFGGVIGAGDLPDPAAARYGFDFNPVPDRIRVTTSADGVGGQGLNFRLNPNTGTLAGADTAINPAPISIDEVAYTNNVQNAATTTLYTISSAQDALYIQSNVLGAGGNPNTGTQINTIGLSQNLTAVLGFDIDPTVTVGTSNTAVAAGSGFAIVTVGGTTGLASINLTTGVVGTVAPFPGGVANFRGLAVFAEQVAGGLPAVGLVTGANTLVRFNTAAGAAASTPVAIGGALVGGETILGIDYRPATGQLYGLGVSGAGTGSLYTIDPQTGVAALVGAAGGVSIGIGATGIGFDFNPVSDLIRVVADNGTNLSVNPATGVATVQANINGATGVTSAAYTNSFAGATSTTLYTLSLTADTLFIQNTPPSGTQTAGVPVTLAGGGALNFSDTNGFDIPAGVRVGASNAAAAGRAYAVLEVTGISSLYSIQLATGVATLIGPVGANLSVDGLALGDAPAGTVAFTAATASLAEDGGNVTVNLTRTGGSTGSVTVGVTVTGFGSATPGSDFGAVPATVTFADGQTTATLVIPITKDAVVEQNETIVLALTTPTNGAAIGAQSSTTITIVERPAPLTVGGSLDGTVAIFTPNRTTGQFPTTPSATVQPFGANTSNVRTAAGDVNGDGIPDIIAVTGPGTAIRLAVVSGADNTTILVAPFDPFGGNFVGGGFVAAGDFNNDGRADIVVTPDQGGGPRVSIYSILPGQTAVTRLTNFFTLDANFQGGIRPAAGFVDADGTTDLVIAAGFGGGPRILVLNGTRVLTATGFNNADKLVADFFVFPDQLRNGVYVTIGDLDDDGFGDLIFGAGPGGGPVVKIISGRILLDPAGGSVAAQTNANKLGEFFVGGTDSDRGGVRVSTVDADGDGLPDVAVGTGTGRAARTRIYLGKNFISTAEPTAFQDLNVFGGAVLADGVYVG